MDNDLVLVIVVVTALAFDFTNGFHDTANVVATAISTRAMPARLAVGFASILNFVGAFISLKVAATVAKGIVSATDVTTTIIFAGLVGAIAWNLITWYFGLPSSSSHALIGGLVGAALASSTQVQWTGVVTKVAIPMVVSPLVGLTLGYLVMIGLMWLFRRANAHRAGRILRRAQLFSASSLALGHGLQDAQKSMGVIVLALVVTGHQHDYTVPFWVILLCATALAAGTWSGGLRIMRTLGRRIFNLTPPHGFAAELSASSVLYLTAFVFAAPVSTTHVVTSAVMGVGATTRRSAVRWSVAGDIAIGWVLTAPGAATIAATTYGLLSLF